MHGNCDDAVFRDEVLGERFISADVRAQESEHGEKTGFRKRPVETILVRTQAGFESIQLQLAIFAIDAELVFCQRPHRSPRLKAIVMQERFESRQGARVLEEDCSRSFRQRKLRARHLSPNFNGQPRLRIHKPDAWSWKTDL